MEKMINIENSELNNEWGFFIDTEIDESYNKKIDKKFEKIDIEEEKQQYNKKESKYVKNISSFLYCGTTFLVSFSLTYCICCIL
jgi:hypothetical protein